MLVRRGGRGGAIDDKANLDGVSDDSDAGCPPLPVEQADAVEDVIDNVAC